MRPILYPLIAVFIVLSAGMTPCQEDRDVLFQFSTIDALLQGLYEGEVTFGQLKLHGDFGLGTFHRLDGEMIGSDGRFYQVKANGKVYPVPDGATTPFAAVTFFEPDVILSPVGSMNLEQVEEYLDAHLPTKNIFHAVKIEGHFRLVKTRSVPAQNRPYPSLRQVTENQPTFSLYNVRGTMVGFRCPYFTKGINVPGYHFHFLTEERDAGGHVLDVQTEQVTTKIDYTSRFTIVLSNQREFYELDFSGDEQQEVEKAEQ